jgi:hypothetical protein
MHFM